MPTSVPQPARRAASTVAEFFAGVRHLLHGFSWWRRRPGLMASGLIPAAIVGAGLVALVVFIGSNAGTIVAFLTPFADSWDPAWSGPFRTIVAIALIIGLVILAAFTFTGLTLLVGDWFYERIWREVETELGGMRLAQSTGFWRAVGDGLRLTVRTVVTSVLLALLSLIPVIGTAAAITLGVLVASRVIALELTTRPLEARGLGHAERRAALRSRPARTLGFGAAVYVCFLVPGGAIVVMPAAVAGATELARAVLPDAGQPVSESRA